MEGNDPFLNYPPVLDVKDVQEILGISRGNAYELFHSQEFHIVKVGRRLKVSKAVFLRWLEGERRNQEKT